MDQPTTPPLAIASAVFGGLSLLCVCFCYGFPFNILGLVTGIIAIVQANQDPTGQAPGKGLAYVGVGTSALSFVVVIGMMVLGFGAGMLSALMQNANY